MRHCFDQSKNGRRTVNDIDFKIKCLATQGGFGQSAYLADHLYKAHGLDENKLVEETKSFLKS